MPRPRPAASFRDDPYLEPFRGELDRRVRRAAEQEEHLTGGECTLADFASGHEYYGMHRTREGWVFREWAPNATAIGLVGAFSDWQERDRLQLRRLNEKGDWEIRLASDAVTHGDLYRLRMHWHGGEGDRLPTHARRVVQDADTGIFNAQIWRPPEPYDWQHEPPADAPPSACIYEAHVGMATEAESVGSYVEFRDRILPRIVRAGYDTVQLMAVMEHPYYGSFGYHVSNFFAASSRFGTPEELKSLIDAAHGMGLRVIMDLVHSHAVKNETEGLARFDGTPYQFFHDGPRGEHRAWDSRCFDYSKPEVLHFLLSNCRFWLDEYRVDGFRFDGVTSMLYLHHGLGEPFTSYGDYFSEQVDEDALTYLVLANQLIHAVYPDALTVAEDVSGLPGLAAPGSEGGCGFDFTLAMGVPDCWFRLVREYSDEEWPIGTLWHELCNRRDDERTISYVESHDQAIVGSKTMIFELIDADMYHWMRAEDQNLRVDRGMALHKMTRLATLTTAGDGYLNFMGNEFGHPEWVDFPREGNGWSYHYARRRWSLVDDPGLKYQCLAEFDRAMIDVAREADLFAWHRPHLLKIHEEDKVLAFARTSLLLIFNFHPHTSHSDYEISVDEGEYELVLDTDESRFGGHARLEKDQRYFTRPVSEGHILRVYLPARAALVLRKCSSRSTGEHPEHFVG